MKLNSILIGSEDPGRLAAYYTPLFGKPVMEGDGYTSWMIGDSAVTVGPHDQVHGKNPAPGRLLWNIESSDVKGDFERLKAAGAIVIQEPYHPSQMPDAWIATLADPDDNYFQLMSPFDPSGL